MELRHHIKDRKRIIVIILCIIALIGFILPVVNINIGFLGYSTDISVLNLTSLFNSDSQFGTRLSGSESSSADMFDLSGRSEIFTDMGVKLILIIVSYSFTILLLIIILIFTLINKYRKVSNVMTTISFLLYAYVGYAISTLTETLFNSVEEKLGFSVSQFNMSDMIKINIGTGYWLTIFAIGSILFFIIIARKYKWQI